jgi:hypothetical protein
VVGLIAIGLAIVAGDVWLAAISWRTRTVLAGLLATISIALVGLAIASGSGHAASGYALLGASTALVIGAALYGIGRTMQRLLDHEPSESSSDGR